MISDTYCHPHPRPALKGRANLTAHCFSRHAISSDRSDDYVRRIGNELKGMKKNAVASSTRTSLANCARPLVIAQWDVATQPQLFTIRYRIPRYLHSAGRLVFWTPTTDPCGTCFTKAPCTFYHSNKFD